MSYFAFLLKKKGKNKLLQLTSQILPNPPQLAN